MIVRCLSTRRPRGFTLLELLAVVSILAILCTAGLTGWNLAMESARRSLAHTDCLRIENALSQYLALEGRFPPTWDTPQSLEGAFLATLTGEKSPLNRSGTLYFETGRAGSHPKGQGYIPRQKRYNDPWGRPYRVIVDADTLTLPPEYHRQWGSDIGGREIFVDSAGRDGDFSTVENNVTCLD